MAHHWTVVIGLLVVGACGGSEKGASVRRSTGGGNGWHDTAPDEQDVGMIPAEKMDSIKANFDRKARSVSRCLVEAMDANEIGKNERAVITVTVTILPDGGATDVKTSNAEPGSKVFSDCVVGHVKRMAFGALPRRLDYSYTFAFDAL
jgi:hypothetical protein